MMLAPHSRPHYVQGWIREGKVPAAVAVWYLLQSADAKYCILMHLALDQENLKNSGSSIQMKQKTKQIQSAIFV